jgi:hypothetical protein
MYRSRITGSLAGIAGIISATHVLAQHACQPTLAFTDVQFSEMQPPTLQRKWSAVVSVDATRCLENSIGDFDIVFTRLKEGAPDLEFRQHFKWLRPSVKVAVDFWADEAVERYRIDNVTPCSCARSQ